ncbi:MAG: lytic transglycosylase, partial [Rhodobacteraceae bacterium]|nr:lytic transglycosylase [Paracoccaceae bacterium]
MKYLALIILVILGSCARESSPPTRQDDACAILDQRHGWLRTLQRTEAEWGTPVHVMMAIIWKESSFRARAKTRRVYV